MNRMSILYELPRLHTSRAQGLAAGICVLSWLLCLVCRVPVFPFGVLIPLLTVASVTDLTSRRIPNWLTYSAAGFAISAAAVVSVQASIGHVVLPGVIGFRESVSGFAAVFGVMLVAYHILGIGAGDVKLAGAIGACIGVQAGLQALVWTHLVAGAVIGVHVGWKVGPRWFFRQLLFRLFPGLVLMPTADHSKTFRYPVPMAAFFAGGTVMALLEVPLL
ncbi:MAG: prepilin peptidase [Planctomycetaceae bacterium]|nr:prepilin peptidase [Planctomycetaceae bacterium]